MYPQLSSVPPPPQAGVAAAAVATTACSASNTVQLLEPPREARMMFCSARNGLLVVLACLLAMDLFTIAQSLFLVAMPVPNVNIPGFVTAMMVISVLVSIAGHIFALVVIKKARIEYFRTAAFTQVGTFVVSTILGWIGLGSWLRSITNSVVQPNDTETQSMVVQATGPALMQVLAPLFLLSLLLTIVVVNRMFALKKYLLAREEYIKTVSSMPPQTVVVTKLHGRGY